MDIGRRDFLQHGSAAVFGLAAGLLPCERAVATGERTDFQAEV